MDFSAPVCNGGPVVVCMTGETDGTGFIEGIRDSFVRTFITESRWKMIARGMWVTIWISALSVVLGSLLGFAVSFPLRSKNRTVRTVCGAVTTFLDALPLAVILLLLYSVVFTDIDIPAAWIGVFGFTLDFANTVAGLLNTGVLAVDKGQLEAAESMGYSKWSIFAKITFPQAARQMYGQYQGAIGSLIKGTSIVGYITVEDLTRASDLIRARTFEAFFSLITTAVLYFIIARLFGVLAGVIGRRLEPKNRPRSIKGVKTHDHD